VVVAAGVSLLFFYFDKMRSGLDSERIFCVLWSDVQTSAKKKSSIQLENQMEPLSYILIRGTILFI
jgi:hypothetical protein